MASRPIRVTIVRFAWRIAAGRAFALQQNERGRGLVSAGGRALRISDGPRRLSVPPFAAYRPQARPPTDAGVSACDALALSGHGSCGSPFLCWRSQLAESGGVPAVNPFAGRSGGSAGWPAHSRLSCFGAGTSHSHTREHLPKHIGLRRFVKDRGPPNFHSVSKLSL